MQLTAPELEIHKLLWQEQPQTGKAIHSRLEALYGWTYSSTRKTLERMLAKEMVRSENQGNKKIYYSLLDKVPTLAMYAQDFAKRVLEIDGPVPISMFSDSQLIKPDELKELEQLLQQFNDDKEQGKA
jgi:predicted transcriptional regulator